MAGSTRLPFPPTVLALCLELVIERSELGTLEMETVPRSSNAIIIQHIQWHFPLMVLISLLVAVTEQSDSGMPAMGTASKLFQPMITGSQR